VFTCVGWQLTLILRDPIMASDTAYLWDVVQLPAIELHDLLTFNIRFTINHMLYK